MIDQIEIYGPAWSDIARLHCKPGGRLEGRDQAKLKDKARNLKEKFIKYHPEILIPHHAWSHWIATFLVCRLFPSVFLVHEDILMITCCILLRSPFFFE